jgi:hypothetical protein
MAVQSRTDLANIPFLLEGKPLTDMTGTILQIAGRTVPLLSHTLMAQVASSEKWVPWLQANLAGTTGTQRPAGIYMGDDITAAALAAADVVNCPIMRGGQGVVVDEGQIVFDKGDSGGGTTPDLTMIPTVPTNQAMTARTLLNFLGIFPKSVISISAAET